MEQVPVPYGAPSILLPVDGALDAHVVGLIGRIDPRDSTSVATFGLPVQRRLQTLTSYLTPDARSVAGVSIAATLRGIEAEVGGLRPLQAPTGWLGRCWAWIQARAFPAMDAARKDARMQGAKRRFHTTAENLHRHHHRLKVESIRVARLLEETRGVGRDLEHHRRAISAAILDMDAHRIPHAQAAAHDGDERALHHLAVLRSARDSLMARAGELALSATVAQDGIRAMEGMAARCADLAGTIELSLATTVPMWEAGVVQAGAIRRYAQVSKRPPGSTHVASG